VIFIPQVTGAISSAVVITDNASGSPHSVPLSGTGTQGIASFSPTSLSFGTQPINTTSSPQSVTLTNTGTASFAISGIDIEGADLSYFAITSNNCGGTVAVGGSCIVSVTFTPTSAIAATANLVFTDSAPGSPQSVPLSGTGTGQSAVSFNPASITFPNTPVSSTSAPLSTVATNTGTAALMGISISIASTNAGDFAQTNNCGTSLAIGGSCTITVRFTPSATGGRNANISMADDASGSPQTVPLHGTGFTAAPQASLSTTSISYGNQTVGTQSNPQVVILTNTGSATLTVSTATITGANPGDYGFSTTCGASLAANASCTYSVSFTPTAAGVRTATLNVNTNASTSPNTVSLSGTGIAGPNSLGAPQIYGD
jgi:hypothetical protein